MQTVNCLGLRVPLQGIRVWKNSGMDNSAGAGAEADFA